MSCPVNKTRRNRIPPAGKSGGAGATALCLLAVARATEAQSVLTPPPPFSITPPAVLQLQTEKAGAIPSEETGFGIPLGASLLQWGPVNLRPHLLYRVLYAAGIPAAGTNDVNTVIQSISPGMLFTLGSHWSLDYTPTLTFYSNKQFRDTLDHSVILTGGTAYEDWVFGLLQSYVSSSAPLVQTGTQTDTEIYATALTASYRFNSKLSMDLALNQTIENAPLFTSYREWSTSDYLNYQFWPRFDAGIGAGFGYVAVEAGSDMTYEQYQGRIDWRLADKLSLQLHGGVEDRQFLSGNTGDLINPVFGLAVLYQPVATTTLSVSADRAVSASYFENVVTESTGVTANLNQRLLKKLFLTLSGGYSNVKYVATGVSGLAGRNDNYYLFTARLTRSIGQHASVAVTYQYNDNASNQPFGFTSNQAGLELGYTF